MTAHGQRKTYKIKQVAEMWDCSEHTVRSMIDRGELRALRIGTKMLRVPEEAMREVERAANPGTEEAA